MSLSNDEEDDFQSADEDGFADEDDLRDDVEAAKLEAGHSKQNRKSSVSGTDDSTIIEPEIKQTSAHKLERSPSLSDIEKLDSEQQASNEEDEGVLAERIRERNIKIARKFSAELAKSVKASAPIPVKTELPIGFKVDDIDYPDIPGSDQKVRQPMAPPPTPALSSSFSAEESLSPNQESSGSQYGWRVPIKPRVKQTDTPPKECDIDQARAALDRLSDQYTDTDKSLFQKVADDLKKVSIKSEDPSNVQNPTQATPGPSALPSLSSLGQTFGGWNWNSASRILASASEVTSQVSSVLDSVVNAPRGAPTQQKESSELPQHGSSQTLSGVDPSQAGAKASMSASDAMSNDALVDLTLNAMESLGKKAFGAMTHRDETGSLQIRGLGRPWEQLLNINKSRAEQPEDDVHLAQTDARSSIPVESTKNLDSDNPDRGTSSVRRRVINYTDSDQLD